MIDGPCYNCEIRHTACWVSCARYMKFLDKLAEARERAEEHVADKYVKEQRRKR